MDDARRGCCRNIFLRGAVDFPFEMSGWSVQFGTVSSQIIENNQLSNGDLAAEGEEL